MATFRQSRNARPSWWPQRFWAEGGGFAPTDDVFRAGTTTIQPTKTRLSSFESCDGEQEEYDAVFDQARLKAKKGKIMCFYFVPEGCLTCWRGILALVRPGSGSTKTAEEPTGPLGTETTSSVQEPFMSAALGDDVPDWLGSTLPKRALGEGQGLGWSPGSGTGVEVRCLPRPRKHDALLSLKFGSMYECVSCDAITSDSPITDIMGRLVKIRHVPKMPSAIAWTDACPLPRVICMNVMLPYTGKSDDPGCSYVCLYHIRPEVLSMLQTGNVEPSIAHFQKFCKGPAGEPSNARVETDVESTRSLSYRRNPDVNPNDDCGLVKVIGFCENVNGMGLWMHQRTLLSQFNGKPVTITKSGYIVKQKPDTPGEWLEIGVDVKGPYFNSMLRHGLVNNREALQKAESHICLTIQATEDDQLPEGLVLDVLLHGISLSGLREI